MLHPGYVYAAPGYVYVPHLGYVRLRLGCTCILVSSHPLLSLKVSARAHGGARNVREQGSLTHACIERARADYMTLI